MSDLLKKYWEGKTNVKEEKELKKHLILSDEEGIKDASYFEQLYRFSHLKMKKPLDESLFEAEATTTPTVITRLKKHGFTLRRMTAAIALFLLSLSAFQIEKYQKQQDALAARAAFEEARHSLLLISAKLNKGTSTTIDHLNKFSVAQRKIRRQNKKKK